MGGEAEGAGGKRVTKRRKEPAPAWEPLRAPIPNAYKEMNRRYGFAESADVELLLDELRGFMVYVFPNWSPKLAKIARDRLADHLDEMKKLAEEILPRIASLNVRVNLFENDEDLLRALHDVSGVRMSHPSTRSASEEVAAPYRTFRPSAPWDEVKARLEAIIAFPRINGGGPKANVALQDAVAGCRRFWCADGRTWKSDMLVGAQQGDDVSILTGDCERFVADALGVTGYDFTLLDLRTAFDKKRVKGKSAAG